MGNMAKLFCGAALAAASLTTVAAAAAADNAATDSAKIVMQEFMVPSDEPGIQLYVRNKRPEGVEKFGPDKILLFVHGSTYPA
jgi:predicted secreted protein